MKSDVQSRPQPLEEPPAPGHVRWLAIVTAVVIGSLWLVPLSSSLWEDEFGTWWVVKDGLGDAVHRAVTFQGQSPLYYLIVWAARVVGGNSEVILRLPSLIAAALSAVVLYRLARLLISREAARFTVLAFVASQVVAFEASEARPYAIATLATIGATYALVRWLDDGRRWAPALLYALLAVTVVWLHYLFSLVLVAHALYALVRLRRGETEVTVRRLVAVAMIVTAGIIPLAIQLASLWDRRSSLSIPSEGSVSAFAIVLIPPVLVASVFLGSLLASTQDRVRIAPVPARSSTFVLLAGWLLIPVVTLFLVSALTPVTFLSPRYFASVGPAIALLAGWGIASLEPAAVRRIVAIVLAIVSVLAFGGRLKYGEDWQSAAAFERNHADPATIVLLHPELVESAQLDWFSDPEKRSYLLGVQSYYPMEGHVVPMPYMLDNQSRDYLEGLVTGRLAGVDRFLLVTRYPQVPFRDWLDGRLRPEGYTSKVIGTFGVIQVIEFSRST
jgi:mannosyltransferase